MLIANAARSEDQEMLLSVLCEADAPAATAANNVNIRAGLTSEDLGSPLHPDRPQASARSYMPQGSRVSVIPAVTSESCH